MIIKLQGTYYGDLAGATVRMPSDPHRRPSKAALEFHRMEVFRR